MPAKAKDPTNGDISISTLGTIYEEGVIVFTLGRPQVILKKKETSQRKRNNEDSVTAVNGAARVGTIPSHFLEFINEAMDTLDDHSMKIKVRNQAF